MYLVTGYREDRYNTYDKDVMDNIVEFSELRDAVRFVWEDMNRSIYWSWRIWDGDGEYCYGGQVNRKTGRLFRTTDAFGDAPTLKIYKHYENPEEAKLSNQPATATPVDWNSFGLRCA